jgi:hypothetical protein
LDWASDAVAIKHDRIIPKAWTCPLMFMSLPRQPTLANNEAKSVWGQLRNLTWKVVDTSAGDPIAKLDWSNLFAFTNMPRKTWMASPKDGLCLIAGHSRLCPLPIAQRVEADATTSALSLFHSEPLTVEGQDCISTKRQVSSRAFRLCRKWSSRFLTRLAKPKPTHSTWLRGFVHHD